MTPVHSGVPWHELNPEFQNKDIPPGWFPGCKIKYENSILTLNDQKKTAFNNYETEEGRAIALKNRLKQLLQVFLQF